MNYKCPKCSEELQYKLLPTKPIGDKSIFGIKLPRTQSCPNCNVLLEIATNAEDKKILRLIIIPFALFFISLLKQYVWLQYISGIAMIIATVYVAVYINKPKYKNQSYFKIYVPKP